MPGAVFIDLDENTWPLTGNDGRPVAPGRYSVAGLLLRYEPEPLRSGSVSIEIS